jgi:murein L,D-transpeptidase YcbB/YkuD
MMNRTNMTVVVLAAGASMAFACEEETTPITPQEATEYAEAWAPTVEETLNQRSEGASIQRELQSVIEAAAAKEEAKSTRDEPPYDVFVKEVYAKHDFQPKLVKHGKLTDAGEAIWSDVQNVADHALDAEPYHLEEIATQIEKLDKVAGDVPEGELAATDAEKQWAVNWLAGKTHEDFALTPENHVKVTDALMESDQAGRLKSAMDKYSKLGEELAAESARLEFLLAHDFVKFSRDVGNRHVRTMFIHPRHDDYYNDPEISKASERPPEAMGAYEAGALWRRAAAAAESMANHTKTLHDRIRASLEDVITSDDPQKVVASIWPAQPQYRGLVKEYKRYRGIVDDGGWEEVPQKKRLKRGSKHSAVKKLKKRLQVEGYYPADASIDNTYDEALEKAVEAYQTTHQMEVTGKPHRTFWRSLNVSAEERLEQIAMNLERWRLSNIRHDRDETYVYVNIPDFQAELWDEGKRQMRFGIVVGNNDLVEDEETGEKEHANRTPHPIAAYIDRAIYNPYWNVTPRIREEEVLPEVKEWVEQQYQAKREKKKKEQEHYAALRAALAKSRGDDGGSGSATTTADSTDDSTALTNTVAEEPSVTGSPETADGDSEEGPARDPEFPYIDPETGEVDVSVTDPENIPAWYAENDYEVMHAGKPWEYVRMTPGDHNALGLVKVIFPNLHDVYLHDTNAKPLFKRNIRAFSHGCMRMSKPMEFAEYLLRRDNLYEEANIPKVLEEGTYLPVFLERQVPVFVEYRTVRVDDQGRANFLADIYDLDERGIVVPKPDTEKKAASP